MHQEHHSLVVIYIALLILLFGEGYLFFHTQTPLSSSLPRSMGAGAPAPQGTASIPGATSTSNVSGPADLPPGTPLSFPTPPPLPASSAIK